MLALARSPKTVSPYEANRALAYPQECRAQIASVDEGSPAARAGLEPGMVLVEVEGEPLRDIIEWRWFADGFDVEVTLASGEYAYIEREMGEDWGITFTDSIFDGVITCCNACTFCFMHMLPKDMRPTLYLRDDDYRLSFLQGNFVTLTNVTDEDFERIVEYNLSPLHVSLHAVSPDVRRELMGRNAQRGMDVLEALLDAGIEVHVQVVVVPGVNDGSELTRTLSWITTHSGVLSAGFVPLGYTRFQKRFDRSFSDDPEAAAEVIELIREFQEDSGTERRDFRLHIADEFYLNAGYDFPPALTYGDYPQFQDGIGMMRSFIDEWSGEKERITRLAARLEGKPKAVIVTGTAFATVLEPLVESSPLAGRLEVLPVENRFFGGNVDVSCLLTGADLIDALREARPPGLVIMPRQLFNQDMALLDDVGLPELEELVDGDIALCTYNPSGILDALDKTAQ